MAIKPSSPATTPHTHTLTFPAPIYAALAPRTYLTAHLTTTPPIRPSGRTPLQSRTPTLNTSSLTHANGSAVVRCGDTAVVCGINAEILKAEDVPQEGSREGDEMRELGLLVPNVELSTGCSPKYIPGSAPGVEAQTLTSRVHEVLVRSGLVDLEGLRVWYEPPSGGEDDVMGEDGIGEEKKVVKAYWVLYISILFISLDGNPFDAAWGALLAALRDTKLPRAWWDEDCGSILCDPLVANAKRLRLRGLPVAFSWGVFVGDEDRRTGKERGEWVLADLDGFEEGLCDEEGTVIVDRSEKGMRIVRIEKIGGGVVGVWRMREMVKLAEERWKMWRDVLGA